MLVFLIPCSTCWQSHLAHHYILFQSLLTTSFCLLHLLFSVCTVEHVPHQTDNLTVIVNLTEVIIQLWWEKIRCKNLIVSDQKIRKRQVAWHTNQMILSALQCGGVYWMCTLLPIFHHVALMLPCCTDLCKYITSIASLHICFSRRYMSIMSNNSFLACFNCSCLEKINFFHKPFGVNQVFNCSFGVLSFESLLYHNFKLF